MVRLNLAHPTSSYAQKCPGKKEQLLRKSISLAERPKAKGINKIICLSECKQKRRHTLNPLNVSAIRD